MKIYYDGCSWTWGAELEDKDKRYSKIMSNHYKAEEYNIAERGGCNRRIVRNILDHNIDDFDLFVIQMTMQSRTEWYDEDEKKFTAVKASLPSYLSDEERKYWHAYYEKIYHKKYGITDEKIYYNLLREILRDKKHTIVTCTRESFVPFDMDISLKLQDTKSRIEVFKSWDYKVPYPTYRQCMAPMNHPNELGHKIIAEMLINYLDKT